jgi:hypothetical protein
MEARGVISVTERTATIARIRHLARQVAETWLAERRSLGFPLLDAAQRQNWYRDHPQDRPGSGEATAGEAIAGR